MFMYDPSSEIDDRVLKMVVEVSKVLQDKFGNPNIEVVAYDMSLARLPMKFKQDANFMVNSIYFVERISKKYVVYENQEMSGSLILDFVLRQLSSFGWRFSGNVDNIKFSEEQRSLGFEERLIKEGVKMDVKEETVDL